MRIKKRWLGLLIGLGFIPQARAADLNIVTNRTINPNETWGTVNVPDIGVPHTVTMLGGTITNFNLHGANILNQSEGQIANFLATGPGQFNMTGGRNTAHAQAGSSSANVSQSIIYGQIALSDLATFNGSYMVPAIFKDDGQHTLLGSSHMTMTRSGMFGNRLLADGDSQFAYSAGQMDRLTLQGNAHADLSGVKVREYITIPSPTATVTLTGYNFNITPTAVTGFWAHGQSFNIPLQGASADRFTFVTIATPTDQTINANMTLNSPHLRRNVTVAAGQTQINSAGTYNNLTVNQTGSVAAVNTEVHNDLTVANSASVNLSGSYVGNNILASGTSTTTISSSLINGFSLTGDAAINITGSMLAQTLLTQTAINNSRVTITDSTMMSVLTARNNAVVTLDGVYIDRNPHIFNDFTDKPNPYVYCYNNVTLNLTNINTTYRTDIFMLEDSHANYYSGYTGNDLKLYNRASATIYAGIIGDDLTMQNDSYAEIYGGKITDLMDMRHNGTAYQYGGVINTAAIRGTSDFYMRGGTNLAVELQDDGQAFIAGGAISNKLVAVGNSRAGIYGYNMVYTPNSGRFLAGRVTGKWADGTSFDIHYANEGEVTANHITRYNIDFDSNLMITAGDLALLSANYSGSAAGSPYDLTRDGKVDDDDLAFYVTFLVRTDWGDVDLDHDHDATDIDLLQAAILGGSTNKLYDVNQDNLLNLADVNHLIHNLLNTEYGDLNLDGQVSIGDLTVLAENFGMPGGWASGDQNGDGLVSIGDLTVLAEHFGFGVTGDPFAFGSAAFTAIPTPAAGWAGALLLAGCAGRRFRRGKLRGHGE